MTMLPKLVASKIIRKTLGSNNFVADFPSTTHSSQEVPSWTVNSTHQDTQNYKVFVSTWNVGGISPQEDLNMEDLLDTQNNSCDIYVLGFQEVVPLKPANVLGVENTKICTKWDSLIGKILNKRFQSEISSQHEKQTDELCEQDANLNETKIITDEFKCLMSKKMVGIFISVWVRSAIRPYIENPSVSCVGCGMMGYLGNKGSVSVRFQLYETSFCFVCTHLASGNRECDETNRNTNATDIFARTNFPRGQLRNLPRKILDHDRVILLGDLNYRISLPESATRPLVNRGEWRELLENDQLRRKFMDGEAFEGWREGSIKFAPTYKYNPNSDNYCCVVGQKGRKKRVPAWCDRIIWSGEGMKQLFYTRGESKLSDHRPVKSIFVSEVTIPDTLQRFQSIFLSERFNQISKVSLKDGRQKGRSTSLPNKR